VDNRSGAGGTAGMESVAKSAPDGYTILVTSDRVASAQHAFKLNFDPIKDLAPICQLTRQPLVLAVHHSLGMGSLAEFLARARAQPRRVLAFTSTSSANGSIHWTRTGDSRVSDRIMGMHAASVARQQAGPSGSEPSRTQRSIP
jgi:tripartite-type tricarboxylate transporter receptor subunit TctC